MGCSADGFWRSSRTRPFAAGSQNAPNRGLSTRQKIASAASLAEANPPELVAQRLDRITRFRAGDELPTTTPAEPPEQLAEKAVERAPVPNSTPPEKLLEAIVNTRDFVGCRYLDAGVAAARAVGPHPDQGRQWATSSDTAPDR